MEFSLGSPFRLASGDAGAAPREGWPPRLGGCRRICPVNFFLESEPPFDSLEGDSVFSPSACADAVRGFVHRENRRPYKQYEKNSDFCSVKVHTRVIEGGKERVQIFQGIVIGKRGAGVNEAFTVRKISYGEGVERSFPLHTPKVARIDVVTHGKVRRAKLNYLRQRIGKEAMFVKTAR